MEKRDWKNIVKESDGGMQFVPEKFLAKVKEWQKKRATFDEQLEIAARNEIELGVLMNEIILGVRNHFSDAGLKIWQKDVGLNQNALHEGEFIINISDQK